MSNLLNSDIDSSLLLLKLLKEGKSNTEICRIMHYDLQTLYNELLKFKNFDMWSSRKYYSDGSIVYDSSNMVDRCDDFNGKKILITKPYESEMRFLLISDLHFGNISFDPSLIDKVFNYCIKNNIHTIFCCGDVIDGVFSHNKQILTNPIDQVEHFLKCYPSNTGILTFSVLGNHDFSAMESNSIDLSSVCTDLKHDFIVCGYGNADVNIKSDKIHLYHYIENRPSNFSDSQITFRGHSHKYSTRNTGKFIDISVPSLCDMGPELPGCVDVVAKFSWGYIVDLYTRNIKFYKNGDEKVFPWEDHSIYRPLVANHDSSTNVEAKRVITPDVKTLRKTSQVDKFKARYGLK